MQMLIDKNLIPEDMIFYKKLFLFNKFLKKYKDEIYYDLNDAAIGFLDKYFDLNFTVDGDKILQKTWDNTYKKAMDPMRNYLKQHTEEMLSALNNALYQEVANKYGQGTISKWEMDSLSFYYHNHELESVKKNYDDFFTLSEEPEIDYSFISSNGKEIKIFKLHQIIGTVIDKNKLKNTISLLTPTGVVTVKIYKNQYSMFDKQISQIGEDGKKHIVEGIRRGNDFIPKKYKSSTYPIISKIVNVSDDGELTFQYERVEVDS